MLCGPTTEQMQQRLARYPRFQTRTGGINADDAAAVEIGKTILIKDAHGTDAGSKKQAELCNTGGDNSRSVGQECDAE